ncbi:MAG: ABC transporter substrate-binding protein [Clostridiaceae bacterium]|nr:ABC transporter substrate-binding protein [Clostridiaceae bacterium]
MLKRVTSMVIILVLILALTAGCANSASTTGTTGATGSSSSESATANTTTGAVDNSKRITLDWYMATWGDKKDADAVYAEVSKIMQEKLNVDLQIHYYEYGDYDKKVSTMVNAGQKMDILFTSDSLVPFLNNVRQGNFLALDDLLPQYAPKTYANIPKAAWDAVTVDGHIYGIVPMKDLADCYSMQYDSVLTQELGLTPPKSGQWQTMFDLLDFLYKGKEARDAMYPDQKDYPIIPGGNQQITLYYPYEPINFLVGANIEGTTSFAGKGDGETVFNVFDTPEYLKYAQTIKKMVDDKIFPYDPKNFDKDKQLPIKYLMEGSQGMVTDYKTNNPNNVVTLPKEAYMYNNYVRAQLNAISAKCEYPERAMQVIEYVNQDKLVATMLRFGIKDVHWKDIGNNQISFDGTANADPKSRGYYYWYGTTFGSLEPIMLPDTEDLQLVKKIVEMTKNSNQKGNLGFIFDETPVINEIAACRSVYDEYNTVLMDGLAEDVDSSVAEFVAKLKSNGAEKIVAEAQKQLTDWRKLVGRPVQ